MPRRYSYPENLLFVLHLNEETQRMISYDVLTDDQHMPCLRSRNANRSCSESISARASAIRRLACTITSRKAERETLSGTRCAGCTKILRGCTTSQMALKHEPHICGSSSKRRNESIVNAAALPLRRICIIRGWKPCTSPPSSITRLAGTV